MSRRQPQPKLDGITKPDPPPAPPKKEFILEEFPSADVTFALSYTRCIDGFGHLDIDGKPVKFIKEENNG